MLKKSLISPAQPRRAIARDAPDSVAPMLARGSRSGFNSPAASLDGLLEHPAMGEPATGLGTEVSILAATLNSQLGPLRVPTHRARFRWAGIGDSCRPFSCRSGLLFHMDDLLFLIDPDEIERRSLVFFIQNTQACACGNVKSMPRSSAKCSRYINPSARF